MQGNRRSGVRISFKGFKDFMHCNAVLSNLIPIGTVCIPTQVGRLYLGKNSGSAPPTHTFC
jgi:hypothetical protein